ncbi:MAG TPA: M48 family metalloprotease [Solirubrobacterales bacterium]|nr:M48 family metalloprotease [Solirubrobacterales bacterium]
MHTQAESDRRTRRHPASGLSAATGLPLYLLTFLGEGILGAGARWLLAWPLAATVGAIVPLGLSAGQAAWLIALAPLAWSASALIAPGRGWLWTRRVGGRRPSAEEALAIEDADGVLRGVDPSLPAPPTYVLDDPLPAAAARGSAVLLSRGLLESPDTAAVYAHELGHLRSLDARLTEALDRLELWGDPLGPLEPRDGEAAAPGDDHPRGLLLGCLRWLLRLAGGGCAEALLRPLWAAHWRSREYAADAHAAALGQAEDLARHLADQELPFDPPQRRFLLNRAEHPPVAHRIERLTSV